MAKEEEAFAKLAENFNKLNQRIVGTVAGFATLGTIFRGLQNTREGYQLGYAIQHVFFEIANALRGPIRAMIQEFEGFAKVIRAVGDAAPVRNYERSRRELFDLMDEAYRKGDKEQQRRIYGEIQDLDKWEVANKNKKPKDNLQPMLTVSYGQVQDLQAKIQSLSLENPAQDNQRKGLTLIEKIAQWIYY